MTLVIDASVASKWVLPEDGAELASRLRERSEDLIAPSHRIRKSAMLSGSVSFGAN
jgi:predicted nucleic acid-binding protein